jgi:ADP-ribosyl-[dinitrogen reductase] hydrolase
MYGAIIGDVVGSPYEFSRNKRKDFSPLFHRRAGVTDDTIMTVAIADSLLNEIHPAVSMRDWARRVLPTESLGGYGKGFIKWLAAPEIQPPYHSFGNGAAMRISPVGWLFDDLPIVLEVAKIVTEVSHSHPEGIKGAQAVAMSVYLARKGGDPQSIREAVAEMFGYDMDRDVAICQAEHVYNETCQYCVPEALICAFEAHSYEDAIRNAISLGGDADTLAAIAGSVAEPLFGIPDDLIDLVQPYLAPEITPVITRFYAELTNRQERL